jgi:hypothetical protein
MHEITHKIFVPMASKKFIISSFAFGAVLIASSVTPATAAIDEALMYPGATCTKLSGGTPTIDANGRLLNKTASTMTVLCPIFDHGTRFTGSVWVIDNSSIGNISCSAQARNPTININPNLTQTQTTSGSSLKAKQLDFTGPNVDGLSTYRFYTCTLPAGTTLINYRGKAQ